MIFEDAVDVNIDPHELADPRPQVGLALGEHQGDGGGDPVAVCVVVLGADRILPECQGDKLAQDCILLNFDDAGSAGVFENKFLNVREHGNCKAIAGLSDRGLAFYHQEIYTC